MRHAWIAIFLLMTGCADYPVYREGSAWNPNGINYSYPGAAAMYGSGVYGSYSSYPGLWWSAGPPFYFGYPGYSYLGYPCGSIWGCGAPVLLTPVVSVPRPAPASSTVALTPVVGVPRPAPASAVVHVARPHAIARSGLSLRSGSRHRSRR